MHCKLYFFVLKLWYLIPLKPALAKTMKFEYFVVKWKKVFVDVVENTFLSKTDTCINLLLPNIFLKILSSQKETFDLLQTSISTNEKIRVKNPRKNFNDVVEIFFWYLLDTYLKFSMRKMFLKMFYSRIVNLDLSHTSISKN